ncbi:MAG: hypothetical protein JSU09_01535 [Bacteroidetes bacterium]|nr:hypothetical protein [Bacteroidota bacterium]
MITQFNLKGFTKSSKQSPEEWFEWTAGRIDLFKKYCLPSILNQSNKQFTWLIFFDIDTQSYFATFLKELEAYKHIKVCYSRGVEGFAKEHMTEVKAFLKPSDKWIVTTRLDNDDMLHQDAIKIIQQNLIEKSNFMISLASGYVLDTNTRKMAHYFYPMSPFITLIESVSENPNGVFAKLHTQWSVLRLFVFKEIYLEFITPSKRQSRFILKEPLWIQAYHKKNVSNSFYRGFPVLTTKSLADFGIPVDTVRMSLKELPKFANYVIWKRYAKSLIVKTILGK